MTVTNVPAQGFPELPDNASPGSGEIAACRLLNVEGTARCGVFRVWEDRGAQAGRTLDISFVVLDALEAGARQPDPVVLLPGGPGQRLVAGAAFASDGYRAARRFRDILIVDVRGVGRSAPLSCDVPFPGGLRSRFDALFPVDHAQACRDSLVARARLDLYTTASSVDDLEELRRWLRYDRVNLDGASYGTRVAQVYMRRHPEAIRTVVLNGVAPVSEPLYVQHAALLQRPSRISSPSARARNRAVGPIPTCARTSMPCWSASPTDRCLSASMERPFRFLSGRCRTLSAECSMTAARSFL